MKINKKTRHYARWEYWLKESTHYHATQLKTYPWSTRNRPDDYYYREFDVEETYVNGERVWLLWSKPLAQPNLCLYFWVVMLRSPVLKFNDWLNNHAIIQAILIYMVFITILGAFLLGIIADIETFRDGILFAVGFSLMVGIVVGAIGLVSTLADRIDDYRERTANKRRNTAPKEPKTPIVIEYLKAKKQKVCPIIEFEE